MIFTEGSESKSTTSPSNSKSSINSSVISLFSARCILSSFKPLRTLVDSSAAIFLGSFAGSTTNSELINFPDPLKEVFVLPNGTGGGAGGVFLVATALGFFSTSICSKSALLISAITGGIGGVYFLSKSTGD